MKTLQCRCKNIKAFVKSPGMSSVPHARRSQPGTDRNDCQVVVIFYTSCKMLLNVDTICAFMIIIVCEVVIYFS